MAPPYVLVLDRKPEPLASFSAVPAYLPTVSSCGVIVKEI